MIEHNDIDIEYIAMKLKQSNIISRIYIYT